MNFDFKEYLRVEVRFKYWCDGNVWYTGWVGVNGSGSYSKKVVISAPGTTYYFRVELKIPGRTLIGNTRLFTTNMSGGGGDLETWGVALTIDGTI